MINKRYKGRWRKKNGLKVDRPPDPENLFFLINGYQINVGIIPKKIDLSDYETIFEIIYENMVYS